MHEPCSEQDMRKKVRANTICATLRKAYRRIDDEEARLLIRIATTMAKKMGDKLEQYKKNWDAGFWDA